MRKSIVVFLCVGLACISGYGMYYYTTQRISAPTYTPPAQEPPGKGVVGSIPSDTDSYDVLISYTDDGFSPRDITIPAGARVRFLNDSDSEVWPASGVHPTHTLYPEKQPSDCLGSSFDSCRALKKGEFYDYTFYYQGVWPYHDHEHAYDTGRITVIEQSGE